MTPKEKRRFYGMVDSEMPATASAYSRVGLVLDCADANHFDSIPDRARDLNSLALVRDSSTPKRLRDIFQLRDAPKEGNWLEVEIEDKPDSPRAWVLEAANDYVGPAIASNISNLRFIDDLDRTERRGDQDRRWRSSESERNWRIFVQLISIRLPV